MKKWLKVAAGVAALATVVTLSGCGAQSGDGKTQLSFLMWGDGGDADQAYKDVIASFEKKNPNITVNAEFVNTNDYDNILKTRLSGGAGPDVYGFDIGNIKDFVRDGFATDLTKDDGDYLDKLNTDAAKESLRDSPDGDAYNVPVSLSGNGIIYNKALFEQAGITEPPTTYTEFLADSKKLLDAGITPLAMSAQDNWWPQFIVYYALAEHGANEKLAAEMSAGKATFADSKAWKESLDIVKQLVPYYMPDPLGTSETAAQSAFLQGKAAMWPATWVLPDARKANLDVGYMNFPTVDEPSKDMWGTYQVRFGVNPGNDKVEAAQKFLNYFFEDDVYKTFLSSVKLFPTTKTVEVGADVDPLYPDMQKAWEGKTFIAAFSPTAKTVQDALLVGLQNVIGDQKSTTEVLDELDVTLKQYLADNK